MILKTGIDTHAREAEPSQNYGSGVKLWVNGGGGSNDRFAYIFFARPFPLGVTVLEATLRLTLSDAWPSTQTLTAKRITESWKEGRLTWNNKPATSATNAGSVNVASLAARDEIEIDLTDMLADVAAGQAWHGVRLELSASANRSIISSDHPNAELRPTLEIVWSEAPQAPGDLAPSGARAISDANPLLTWTFIDNAGSTVQASSQVQVHSSTDFTTPDYDSGKVANTASQFDLALVTFTDLSDDEVAYWRVKVWDGTDLESEWSETAQFQRKTQGTLTIDNPDPAPNNFVGETTPPIAWTLSGRTQAAYAVYLFRLGDGGAATLLASQPRVTSTDTEWAVPAGILRTGDTYRVDVYTWDTIDRQGMAGDPGHVFASRTFTYVREGSPAPVTSLVATADGAKVELAFSRSSDPDYFAVVVDGVEVIDRIEPGDVFVSGDDYVFDYWLATPRVEHDYEVEAVVNDGGVLKHSDGNALDSATTRPIGIVLVDPDDSLAVFIAGKEKASMSIGEVSGLFDPLGSRAPVRVTDTVQGYEGSFNGILLDAEARDDFLEMKGRLKRVRLIIGDLNLPVELGEVSCIPSPDGELAGYDVSFVFAQVDEFDEHFTLAGG